MRRAFFDQARADGWTREEAQLIFRTAYGSTLEYHGEPAGEERRGCSRVMDEQPEKTEA